MDTSVADGTQVVQYDQYLKPYVPQLKSRYQSLCQLKQNVSLFFYFFLHSCLVLFGVDFWIFKILHNEGGLDRFSRGYERFGFQVGGGGISFREYAPAAVSITIIGDFSE